MASVLVEKLTAIRPVVPCLAKCGRKKGSQEQPYGAGVSAPIEDELTRAEAGNDSILALTIT